MPEDAFTTNIAGAQALVYDDTNKVSSGDGLDEGVLGDYIDVLELPMSDEELLSLRDQFESASDGYYPKIKARQQRNKIYLRGAQRSGGGNTAQVVPKNLLFEATATFVPASLAENPEPVVFSDNTDEGKAASNDLKTMLQYHADILGLRQKLGVMVWQWSEYFVGAVKHGWQPEIDDETGEDVGDITTELRKPQNLVLDPEGYVDEFGDFKGWLGDKIERPAEWWISAFPKHTTYFTLKANGKLGTMLSGTEWWSADDKFTFTTMQEMVLDKHKNQFFNYQEKQPEPVEGAEPMDGEQLPPVPTINHFSAPKKPFTFFSVFSLQEEPYDFTNLIEQNIPNQERINDRDDQISKNLASGNNAVAISGQSFNAENADQAVATFYQEGFLLIPDGNMEAVKRIPASALPAGIMDAQASDMQALRQVYGTSGLVPNQNPDEAVRNNIMNEQHDSSRIGGGVGDRLEITAKNIFNWWAQLYCVFYDTQHFGAVMGNAAAIEYVSLSAENMHRKFVVTVAPNSMAPKDEASERSQAIQLATDGFLDPINLFKALNDPDPVNTAKMVTLFRTNPAAYFQTFFPEQAALASPVVGAAPVGPNGQAPPEQGGAPAAPASDSALANVPLNPLPS